MDSTWFNGVLIGGSQGNALREYTVPGHVIKAGKNSITMRIVDYGGDGGVAGKESELLLKTGNAVFPCMAIGCTGLVATALILQAGRHHHRMKMQASSPCCTIP
jgi:hypothetical protein